MLFSKKDLFRIVIPLLLQETLGVTVGMLDSIMVASAGEAAVSAVSLVNTIHLLIIYVFSALAGGGAITISQALGCQDYQRSKNSAKQLVWITLLTACLMSTIALLFRNIILNLTFGDVPVEIMRCAQSYFLYIILTYPFIGIQSACGAIFRAAGHSKISLFTSIVVNVLNIIGNAILIYGFHWGATGAAIATLVSHIVGAVIMLFRICKKTSPIPVEDFWVFRPQWRLIRQICHIGIPNSIESGMFQLGKLITQSMISTLGTVQIAANAAATPLTSLQYIPGTAISLSMVVIVGRCIGAGQPEQARYYTKRLMTANYLMILTVSVVMSIFSKQLIGFYKLSEEATVLGIQLLLIHSLCACTLWPTAFTLADSFRAANDVKYPMMVSMLSMWTLRIGLAYLLGLKFGLGIIGIWAAMIVDWTFRAVIFAIHFIRGKWLTVYELNG